MTSKLIGQLRRPHSAAELSVSDPPPEAREPGPFIRKFREKFAKRLQELCGVDGEALMKLCKVKYFYLN